MYCANDASKCSAYFLFKKWHKFLSSWQRYSKIFQNSRATLIILTNFLAGKLLWHIDLVDLWHHQQTGRCRNKFLTQQWPLIEPTLHTDNQDLKPKFSISAIILSAEYWLLSAKEKDKILNESEFSNKINICIQWRTQKVSIGGLKFRRTVTPQIIVMESAEGKTIVGWSGGTLRKKFAKLH